MGLLDKLKAAATRAKQSYVPDESFLHAAASAAALVVVADGEVEQAEIEAAVEGMMSNQLLSKHFPNSKIEHEVTAAITRAKSMAGKIQNKRFIEAVSTRDVTIREDIVLIAADVTSGNSHGLGDKERAALEAIGKAINIKALDLIA